jgi:hypothetical protein
MLIDIKAPSLKEIILNAALALLFYVCGHGFLFQSCSVGNPQYVPEVWHPSPGTICIIEITVYVNKLKSYFFLVSKNYVGHAVA